MAVDSDPIIASNHPDDFTSIAADAISGIQYKLIFFLFLIFIIITSDIFNNRVLSHFKGALDFKNPTNYGCMIQGMFLVLFYIIIDIGIKYQII